MRSRTLERMRWLSVLCLAGAAMCFAWVEWQTNASRRDWADFPSPAPGMPVKVSVDVPSVRRYQLSMEMPLPAAARDSIHMPELSPQSAGLRVVIDPRHGDSRMVEIPQLVFCSEFVWGGTATYCSEPFELSAGSYEIEVSTAEHRLPPGRALSIVKIGDDTGFWIMHGFMRFLGWVALATGTALWCALAFAHRYAPSDARR